MPTKKQLAYWESLKGKRPKNMDGLSLGRGWNKGKAWSETSKEKMSNAQKERFKNDSVWNKGTKGVVKAWNKGLKTSEENVEKLKGKRPKATGSKNHRWKGGVTPINQRIRHSLQILLWKTACMKRDNFTCQKTGQKGGKLVVHHINNFADFPERRTLIENGITVSKEAHIEFHKIYGTRNTTLEQLQEFLKG